MLRYNARPLKYCDSEKCVPNHGTLAICNEDVNILDLKNILFLLEQSLGINFDTFTIIFSLIKLMEKLERIQAKLSS